MVVANALAALTEIRDISSTEVVQYTPQLLFKLLRALNECTEWGQVSQALKTSLLGVAAVLEATPAALANPRMSGTTRQLAAA